MVMIPYQKTWGETYMEHVEKCGGWMCMENLVEHVYGQYGQNGTCIERVEEEMFS